MADILVALGLRQPPKKTAGENKLYAVTMTEAGRKKVLHLVATSEKDAREAARVQGGSVVRVHLAAGSRPLKPVERKLMLERLAVMVEARMGLSRALQSMADTMDGAQRHAAAHLLAGLAAGLSLPDAMASRPQDWPTPIVSILRGGMSGGAMAAALRDAVEFETAFADAGRSAKGGLISGGAMLAGAAAVMISTPFTMRWILETFDVSRFPSSPEIEESLRAVEMMGTAAVVGAVAAAFSLLLVVSAFMLGGPIRRFFPHAADRVIMRIPYFREMVLAEGNYATLHQLALLLGSGLRLDESLSLAEANARGAMARSLRRAVEAVRAGQNWPSAMIALAGTDRAALDCAPDRDVLSATCRAIAQQYRSIFKARLDAAVPLVRILSYAYFGLSTGLITLQPLYLGQVMSRAVSV